MSGSTGPYRRAENVNKLFDLASEMQDGFTYAHVRCHLRWSHSQFLRVVHDLRASFAEDPITLPCVPQGPRQRWLYRLTVDPDAVRTWHNNRLLDAEERLQTVYNVATSAVRATDGRTLEGKRARLISKVVSRLREDLGELTDDIAG